MLTKLVIENFKRFERAEIELGDAVVLIGPNNSGKTSALQALALWQLGVRKWTERRGGKSAPQQRSGVAINRKDLIALPVPEANLLWRDLHLQDTKLVDGKKKTVKVRIRITVEGVTDDRPWTCGLEFRHANEESFHCAPIPPEGGAAASPEIAREAAAVRVAFLPPMSGLAANETRLPEGAIEVRIGEGRTADVLRNLCYRLAHEGEDRSGWEHVVRRIEGLFGITLHPPEFLPERGEIEMDYTDPSSGARLDISCAGRGLHQTLLLLAYLQTNPRSVLLLDEPDAHLEILRQRQTYALITATARAQESQVIAASHSEIVLNEAAGRDVVIAFVGSPHRVDDRNAQVRKALRDIGFEAYIQAEIKGWVLYLEGSTDLSILQELARILDHPAGRLLDGPFVHYVANQPQRAREHFFGVCEAKPDLVGVALFDRLESESLRENALVERMWSRREIENYLFLPDVLRRYARHAAKERAGGPLFEELEISKSVKAMEECLGGFIPRFAMVEPQNDWWRNQKASDELDRIFERYFAELRLPNLIRKTHYHVLAQYLRREEIDPEVSRILDAIVEVAGRAKPRA